MHLRKAVELGNILTEELIGNDYVIRHWSDPRNLFTNWIHVICLHSYKMRDSMRELHFSGEVSVPHLRLNAASLSARNYLWAILRPRVPSNSKWARISLDSYCASRFVKNR